MGDSGDERVELVDRDKKRCIYLLRGHEGNRGQAAL